MIYHYKLSRKLNNINWKSNVRHLVAKIFGSSSSKSYGKVSSSRFGIQSQQRKIRTQFSVNKIISNELFSLISLPFNQTIKAGTYDQRLVLNAKLVGAILPFELCMLATTANSNIQKKNKISIKSFAKKIEQEQVTKTFGTYLSVKV